MKIPQLIKGATGTLTRNRTVIRPNGERVRPDEELITPFTILEVRTKDFITNWFCKGASNRVYATLPKKGKLVVDESNETEELETSEQTDFGFIKTIIYTSKREGQEYTETLTFKYLFN